LTAVGAKPKAETSIEMSCLRLLCREGYAMLNEEQIARLLEDKDLMEIWHDDET
jgi:hypothetical protein